MIKCINCGADQALHHYDTNQCPKNGIEEIRKDYLGNYIKQEWEDTQ